jgi:hypothetical protein
VTNDELEQPVAEFVGAKKVCEFLGVGTNYLYKMISWGFPKKSKYKVVVIKDMQYYNTPESKRARERFIEKRCRVRKGA